jgi:hypothetical protein
VKISKPTKELPQHSSRKGVTGKYLAIYSAVDKLKPDEWLPVQFATAHEAYNFRVAVATHRHRLMEAVLRGSEVYVRNKPATNGTRKERGKS